MNNRYICKGKRKDNGEWVRGYYVCNGEHCYIFSGKLGIINKNFNWERYEVIPETVGQCTGLTDKNGKLIFEGIYSKVERAKIKKIGKDGLLSFLTEAFALNEKSRESDDISTNRICYVPMRLNYMA